MPKLLYLATEDWAFCQHFLPMARVAREAGFDVAVAARASASFRKIEAEGAKFIPYQNNRGSLSVAELVSSTVRLAKIIKEYNADIVHCVNLKMAVLGGLAAWGAGYRGQVILAPTGLGHLWVEQSWLERTARKATKLILGRFLRRPGTHYLFENRDDPLELGLQPSDHDVTMVNGAGVDPLAFVQRPEPSASPMKIAIVARMLKPKGIAEAVLATRLARTRGASVELHLYGAPDPGNRRSFTEDDLRKFSMEPGIYWHGQAEDPASVYGNHHVAMLLSYREGLPKTLVEAAAIGRPIITTNVPGCRDIVRDRIEGYVVPLGDIEAAADAICRLEGDPGLRRQMGCASRVRFEALFTEDNVKSKIAELYKSIMSS